MQTSGNFSRKGFTLIEITIVIVIIALLISMSVPFFGNLFTSMGLKAAAREISTTLRTARSYAVSKNDNHSVIFTRDGVTATPDIFYVTDSGGTMVDKGHKTNPGVSIMGGVGTTTIIFTPNGGLDIAAGSATSVTVQNTRGNTIQVSVNSVTGMVEIQ